MRPTQKYHPTRLRFLVTLLIATQITPGHLWAAPSIPSEIDPSLTEAYGSGGASPSIDATGGPPSSSIGGVPDLTSTTSMLPGLPTGELSLGNIDGLTAQLGSLNITLFQLTSSMDQMNVNWAATNQQLTDANVQFAQFNTNWETTNQLLTQVMNPAHMVLIGISAGLGFAFGTVVIQIAAAAAATTAKFIYEAIFHQKRDQRFLERYQSAIQEYEKVTSSRKKIESALNTYLTLFEMIHGKGINTTIAEINQTLEIQLQVQEVLRHYIQNLIQTSLTLNDPMKIIPLITKQREVLSDYLGTLGMQIRASTKLRDQLESLSSRGQLEDICNTMQEQLNNLVQAETALAAARIDLMNDQVREVWEKSWTKQLKEEVRMVERAWSPKHRKRMTAQVKTSATQHMNLYLKANPDWNKEVRATWQSCMNKRSRIAANPILGRIFSRKIRSECWQTAIAHRPARLDESLVSMAYPISDASLLAQEDLQHEVDETSAMEQNFEERPRVDPVLHELAKKTMHDFFRSLRSQQTDLASRRRLSDLETLHTRIEGVCFSEAERDSLLK